MSGPRSLSIRIDRDSRVPAYQQIAGAIRDAIHAGRFDDGERLASTRALAARLGIHRNTAVAAYRSLESAGLLRAGVGAGSFVVAPVMPAAVPGEAAEGTPPFAWRRLLRDPQALEGDPRQWLSARHLPVPPDAIQLTGAIAERKQFPLEDLAGCLRAVLDDAGPGILDYGPTEGDERLREWIVEQLREWGAGEIDIERVFIVSGSQQGLDLIGKLLLAPGDAVVLEAPTYTGAFLSLRHAGARLVTVPMGEAGLDLDALEALLEHEPVKFLYTMPCFQNPTGISLGSAERDRLLGLARRYRLAIIEDHYDTDLYYSGQRPRPLLGDDREGQVIHLGTFSKILFPGLRIGWLVIPAGLADSLRQIRWATDLASATLAQRALERFCRAGYLDDHLRRIRRVNARRLRAMLRALEEHFPAAARWTRPGGGMTLWAELPAAVDTVELFHQAAARGVLFSPGIAFYPNGGGRNAMRLSFNRESEARIQRGIALLGEMIAERLSVSEKGRPALEEPLL
ncbi:MAG: PLP-dependent aminotransferase family protein [Candidatus Eisenbacteria sp.]|nr:PLP-dependent aminotransferase family protein [Candidatus Eisenbacteria bacterium]